MLHLRTPRRASSPKPPWNRPPRRQARQLSFPTIYSSRSTSWFRPFRIRKPKRGPQRNEDELWRQVLRTRLYQPKRQYLQLLHRETGPTSEQIWQSWFPSSWDSDQIASTRWNDRRLGSWSLLALYSSASLSLLPESWRSWCAHSNWCFSREWQFEENLQGAEEKGRVQLSTTASEVAVEGYR